MAAWYDFPVGREHDPQDNANGGELGIDLSTPLKTPITTPWGGVVTYSGSNASTGGIVKVVSNIPGVGQIQQYFLHLKGPQIKVGSEVNAGALVGYSGGDQPGAGGWPHVEYGLSRDLSNASEYWGFQTGSTIDPTNVVNFLHTTGGVVPSDPGTEFWNGVNAGLGATGAPNQQTVQAGGNLINITIPSILDTLVKAFGGDLPGTLVRGGLIIGGALLIIVGLVVLILPSRKEVMEVAPMVAKAAAV